MSDLEGVGVRKLRGRFDTCLEVLGSERPERSEIAVDLVVLVG